jgi:UDP-N-acetylmuramate dehydrogenase|tara:strand:- start:23210 stop:24229 length:1020 start_codon:yes stop_codon:yes gene_type:complete
MFQANFDLKPYNTFGISAKCLYFGTFASIEELKSALAEVKKLNLPLMILGGGSNILLTKDYEGIVLRNEIKGFDILAQTENEVIVRSGAGEVWHEFVMKCLDNNLAGIENLSLIPGSVGASPMQNIGAYGVEIKDVFHSVEALHIETGELKNFNKGECEFGYRESVFKRKLKDQYVITCVEFRLKKDAEVNTSYGAINDELAAQGIQSPTIRDVSNAVIAIRQSKLPDPKVIGNAGSFFKNPVVEKSLAEKIILEYPDMPNYPDRINPNLTKLAAGWLLEKAGFKGMRIENYGVHTKQALVLVNYGGSEGKDIYDLSTKILATIKVKFGVDLEREVNII